MSKKQTHCPNCYTKYKVSVAQLTVAQGMVCCAKCSTNFNALSYLIAENDQSPCIPKALSSSHIDEQKSQFIEMTEKPFHSGQPPKQHLLDIFDHKVENSNIDLKTYLNNLNYFSTEPIGNYPALNWSEKSEPEQTHNIWHTSVWNIANICLMGLLMFQFFWFNPSILNSSPTLSSALHTACQMFNCPINEQNYRLISAQKVNVTAISQQKTQFTGELINHHNKSLALPLISVTLKAHGENISSYSLSPSAYIVSNLTNIQHIPQNSPFKFKFSLPVARKSFDNYNLEIIHP